MCVQATVNGSEVDCEWSLSSCLTRGQNVSLPPQMSSQAPENAPLVGWPCTISSPLTNSIRVLTSRSQGLGTSNERLAYGDPLAKLGRYNHPIPTRSRRPCDAYCRLQSSARRHPPTVRKRRTTLAILSSRGYHLNFFMTQVTGSTPKFAFTVPVSPKCFSVPYPGSLCSCVLG